MTERFVANSRTDPPPGTPASEWRKRLAEVPPLLSRKHAADTLGIGLRTLDRLLATRKLPATKVGQRRLIARDALAEYLASLDEGALQ